MHAPRAGAAHPPGRPRPAPRPRPPVHGVRSFGTHRCVYYGRSVAPPARPPPPRPYYKCTHERTCTDRQPPDPRLIGWWREGGNRFPVCALPQFVAKRGSRAARPSEGKVLRRAGAQCSPHRGSAALQGLAVHVTPSLPATVQYTTGGHPERWQTNFTRRSCRACGSLDRPMVMC